MKKNVLNISLILLLASTGSVFAQQGFGTNRPAQSAAVDIVSPNKGLLIPRVALQADNLAAPITNPEPSLLVFNTTATNNLTKGFYYWTGTNWEPFTTESTDSDNQQIIDFSIGANNIVTLEFERGGTKQIDLSPYFNSTKLANGTNTTVSGTGTATDQYKVNVATATESNLGVVQIGSGINVTNGVISVPAAPGETTTIITDALTGTNKHKIADYKNESANAPVNVYETITNLTQDASGITYVKEDGTSASAKVVSANAGNLITTGTDFGALLTKSNVQDSQVKYEVINGLNTTASLDASSTADLQKYKVDVTFPTINGSETKLKDGTNTTVLGTGTAADQYQVNVATGNSTTLGVVREAEINPTVNVTNGELAVNLANTVLSGEVTGPLNATVVADNVIDAANLKADAVTTPKIANNAVTVNKLPAGATSTTFLRGDGTWATPTDNNTDNQTLGLTANELTLERGGSVNLNSVSLAGEVTGPLNATIVADDVIDAANLKTDAVVTTKIANANVTPVKIQPATTFTQTQVMVTGTDGAVKWVDQSTISPATTVSNTSPDNTLITTVNGVPSASVNLVKTVNLALSTDKKLTTTVNGVANTTPLDLSGIDTDNQQLSLTGNTLKLDRSTDVDLTKYDTKLVNGTNTTVNGNGSTTPYTVNVAPATSTALGVVKPGTGLNVTTDGTLNVNFPAAPDGSETKINQGTNVTVTGSGTTASPYVISSVDTNTDNQQLSLTSNTLALTNGGSVDLAKYLDNTDNQELSYAPATNILSLTNGGSVNLSALATDNNTITTVKANAAQSYVSVTSNPITPGATANREYTVGVNAATAQVGTTAGTSGVVKPGSQFKVETDGHLSVKYAMPQFFYMPSIIIDTSVVNAPGSADKTLNLYTQYTTQFNVTATAMRSNGAPAQIPVLPSATDLYYYVTYSDTTSIQITGITDQGLMSYRVLGNTNSLSFVNIVFVIK